MMAAVLTTLVFTLTAAPAAQTYPADAYARPQVHRLRHFEHLATIGIGGGNPVARAKAFAHNHIVPETRDGMRGARWRFQRNPEPVMGAAVNISGRIPRPADAVSFNVRNDSDHPVRFSVIFDKLAWEPGPTFQGGTWIIPIDATVPPRADAVVRANIADAEPTPETDAPAIIFPAGFYIRVENAEPDIPYDLFLSDLAVHYPAPDGFTNAALDAPEQLEAGQPVALALSADAVPASVERVDIELCDGDRVLWRIRLDDAERARLRDAGRIEIARTVPGYAPPRPMTLVLSADGYRVPGIAVPVSVRNDRRPGLPQAELRPRNGLPAVYLNGEPIPWTGYASYDFQPGNVGEFGASGANVFVIPVAAGAHLHKVVDPTWTDWDEWDFGDLDERVATALQANPDGLLEMRANLALPPFWIAEHLEDRALVRTEHGDIPWEETGTQAISLASAAWRADQAKALRRLIAYCAEQPWADRVFAFVVSGEVTEEWFAWGANDGFYSDYSPPMQAAFAAWCRARNLPFTEIPDPELRRRPGWDWYPDAGGGPHAAAYAQFLSDITAEVIAEFAEVIKDASDGRLLTAVLHSYVIQLAGEPRQHLSGNFQMSRLLDDPNLDMFMGIPLHNFRSLTNGYDTYTSATRSMHANGKLHINENDLFSWLHQGIWHTPYNEADPRAGAISMHQRVFATDMIHGAPRQWFSLFTNWHHDAELQAEFARGIALQRELLHADRTPAEEIAFVVDDASFAWMPPESPLHGQTNPGQLFNLARTAAPVGVWLLRDLDKLPDRIKVVFVSSAAAAEPRNLDKLRALIDAGGRTLIIIGPVGLIDRDRWAWDDAAPADITGLPIAVSRDEGPGALIGPIPTLRPRAYIEGDGIATYTDGLTAAAERPLPHGGRLIWCGAPISDLDLLRDWVQHAGVTCYAPIGCTAYACADLVSITASQGGELPLAWPEPVRVRDLFTGWTGQGQTFPCPFAPGQTRLFAVEPIP